MDLARILALLAPPACVSCRAPVAAGERLCAPCTRALPWLRRACPRCALPSHRGRPCPARGAAYLRAWAPMTYEGVARDLVAALKFRAALGVANLMAAHMAANLPAELRRPAIGAGRPEIGAGRRETAAGRPEIGAGRRETAAGRPEIGAGRPETAAARPETVRGGPVIVPVPTVAARRRRRGFDPAGVLAAALGPRLELPVVACLQRRDRSKRQVGTSRKGRRAPGRLAFSVSAPPPTRVLLVDDVHTTGATLDAAARALAAEGALVLAALSYARTP
jgi:predicted amidophosphoribosyltransferase